MLSDRNFLLQVALLFAVTFGAGLWLFNDGPVPQISLKPLTPSAEVPTFEEHIAKNMDRDMNGNEITVDYLRRRTLNSNGYSVISESVSYEKNECKLEFRRHFIATINRFDQYRHHYPEIELYDKGYVTNDKVEDAINSVFLEGMLVIDEFPAKTREWLETFARSGSEAKAQYIQECQAKG